MDSIGKTKQIPRRLQVLMQKVDAGELTIEGGVVIFQGWHDECEDHQKGIHALVRMKAGNPGFSCKKCGNRYQPKPDEWIFYLLCDTCFIAFDHQKQWGRFVTTHGKEPWKYFEDADE